jgi:hypothetical protein
MTALVLISFAINCFGIVAMALASMCSSSSAYGDCYTDGDECGLDL